MGHAHPGSRKRARMCSTTHGEIRIRTLYPSDPYLCRTYLR